MNKVGKLVSKHKNKLVLLFVVFSLALASLVILCYFIIEPSRQYVLDESRGDWVEVGLVLGAGVKDGRPYDELKARLDSAALAYDEGRVDKLILSGDNRSVDYDEPSVMYEYLSNEHNIPKEVLYRDFAGRSTYESCERAAKVFNTNKLVIFSANSHLPRSIYLCRHFGIEAYGIGNDTEANNSTRRELLARVKAVYNVVIDGDNTVLGESISID